MYFLRIFLSIVLTAGLGFGGYAYWLMDEIKRQHAISTEGALFDIANILSSQLSSKVKNGKINTSDFDGTFNNLKKFPFEAVIHDFVIKQSNINVYITDSNRVVLYDSRSKENVGKTMDWRDVTLTLEGKYGARSTQEDENDEFSHVFYVGSAIYDKDRSSYPSEVNKIVGVVSVSKSTESFNNFVFGGQNRIILMVVVVFFAALVLAILFSFWLTRPIAGLISYAQSVARGENMKPPKTSLIDFQKLGSAFEEMRIAIEKKESVKNYVNDVTHALKSPLTAIKATAELLEHEVSQDKMNLFSNIEAEADRATKLLNDLLRIAQLETRIGLDKQDEISIKELIQEVLQCLEPLVKNKKINMIVKWENNNPAITGDRFLVFQIFENLILNAIDFSPDNGNILIEYKSENKSDQIYVRDQGAGIPDYAKSRIFEKFYSLERPSGKKSTGLGLSFVKEALLFHNGIIELGLPTQEMTGANFKLSFIKS
jgi:two-component system, OmpR family, sensor histidine kinase CreC